MVKGIESVAEANFDFLPKPQHIKRRHQNRAKIAELKGIDDKNFDFR